ncbi:MAG: SDR family oxidoreductase [Beijerinckiaceae bacterium]|nr:SDR family oxidoreductase [Beijerinckiaceae bacterium]
MDFGLAGRKALILGASKGLGAATARTLAQEGAQVIAAARSIDVIEGWKAALDAPLQANVSALRLDVSDTASLDAVLKPVLDAGGVDIIVLNSGGPPPGTALEITGEQWLTQFQTMAINLFHIAGLFIPGMRERKWGRIVTIASSGIEQPIPNLTLSNGIRSAVLGWSKTLASEIAADGVTVNMVLPGRILTDRLGQLDEANAKRQNKSKAEIEASAKSVIPAGRYGEPQEFANAVAFLCSDKASYITGIKLRVDGGAMKSV